MRLMARPRAQSDAAHATASHKRDGAAPHRSGASSPMRLAKSLGSCTWPWRRESSAGRLYSGEPSCPPACAASKETGTNMRDMRRWASAAGSCQKGGSKSALGAEDSRRRPQKSKCATVTWRGAARGPAVEGKKDRLRCEARVSRDVAGRSLSLDGERQRSAAQRRALADEADCAFASEFTQEAAMTISAPRGCPGRSRAGRQSMREMKGRGGAVMSG